MTARNLLTLLLLAPLGAPSEAQISVLEPSSGQLGNVRILDETGQDPNALPSGLQGIQLLPIDFNSRTNFQILDLTRPRLFEDLPAASRIRLPGDRGSLYHFRRPDPLDGPDTYGFFLVGSDGRARTVFELAATPDNLSPFLERIAVSPGGDSFLVATSPEADGDLYEVELETGSSTLRTADLDPLRFRSYGLALMESWGVGLCDSGPLRFQRQPDAQGELVIFSHRTARARGPAGPRSNAALGGGPPAWLGDDVVTSADGSTVAVIAGDAPELAFVWTFRASGQAERATHAPQHLSGAGFLPDTLIGPTLALSTDGSRVAYRAQGPVSREAFVQRIEPTGTIPSIQITADANFTDTLNDSGVITFLSADEAILVVGETDSNDADQIDAADVFRVDGLDGALSLSNVTQSSGEAVAPFLEAGDLDTGDGIFLLPDGLGLLIYEDPGSGEGFVRHVDLVSGVTTVVADLLDTFELADTVGGDVVFATRPDVAQATDVYHLPAGGLPALMGTINGRFTSWASHPSGTFASLVEVTQGGQPAGRILARLNLLNGTGQTLSLTPADYGPTLACTPLGAVAATIDNQNMAHVFTWSSPDLVRPLGQRNLDTFLLPGR